jgi:hypothetical protein
MEKFQGCPEFFSRKEIAKKTQSPQSFVSFAKIFADLA